MENTLKEAMKRRSINWEKQVVAVFPPDHGHMTRMVIEEME